MNTQTKNVFSINLDYKYVLYSWTNHPELLTLVIFKFSNTEMKSCIILMRTWFCNFLIRFFPYCFHLYCKIHQNINKSFDLKCSYIELYTKVQTWSQLIDAVKHFASWISLMYKNYWNSSSYHVMLQKVGMLKV